ncbi:hypothetical protein DICPUDRAFT_74835 [Dictyostelium purpureum]|uniref:Uncharacterized protein n=1 Tax=Dictyostelium purpureum TaxID=5786 RepID=F0Z8V8_DICPU|nr:uncharacterized protein DICPUDRAFT_74835 [Dictyostelium purpureum]EGC39644.1 hypothetical protein DICPUDRAFT_74835 [Dictyostelium purpureum]|eukprot:XP_003283865.1 hypothetical protein DICPUDRAFT_74835 [Dictyostelium purpureum]
MENQQNGNLTNPHIFEVMGTVANNPHSTTTNVTDAPKEWYLTLFQNESSVAFQNRTNRDVDIIIFGGTKKFNIAEGEVVPPHYKMEFSIESHSNKEIIPLSDEGEIFVTYKVGEMIQFVIRRPLKCGNSFNVLDRHLDIIEEPLNREEFENEFLLNYPNYTNVPASETNF